MMVRTGGRHPGNRPRGPVNGERGIALIIVLMVVTLLTISVMEFSYTVQLDQHRVRNSIHALQSTLLARSGINIAEGYLMLDEEPRFDAFTEQWWLDLDEFCLGLELEPGMYIRCRVRDESGKINLNLTRGVRRVVESQQITSDAVLRDSLRRIFEAHVIDVDIVDKLADYWLQEPVELEDGRRQQVPDFTSLEDFSATFGVPTGKMAKLRELITAQPRHWQRTININTAPAEVLAAVLNDPDAVSEIIDRQQQEEPFTNAGEISGVLANLEPPEVRTATSRLFGINSRLFRLEASAITNADPDSLRGGGIGQTLSVLVRRTTDVRRRQEGVAGWTLQSLDWQKEGGARLFQGALLAEEESESGLGRDTAESRGTFR